MLKLFTKLSAIVLTASQLLNLSVFASVQSQQSASSISASKQFDLSASKTALEQDLRSIERQYHVVPGVILYAHSISGDEANRLADEGVITGFDSSENYIDLQLGNVLLAPEKDITVSTDQGIISIASGATVFISACNDELVVYDLLQSKPNQVSVKVNDCKISMQPAAVLAVTTQIINNFDQLQMNKDCIAYSNPQRVQLKNNGASAFMSNFSITNALTVFQPLQRLTVSDHPEDKLALDKVIKGAVVLGDLNTTETNSQIANSRTETIAKVGQEN